VAKDYSSFSRHGTITSATWTNTPQWQALRGFGRVTFTNIAQPTNKLFVVSVWVYPESGGHFDQTISSTYGGWTDGWRLIRYDETKLQFRIANRSIDTSVGALPTNRWVHVAARLSNTTSSIFVDGVKVASTALATNDYILPITNAVYIGNGAGGIGDWTGMVADFKMLYGGDFHDSMIMNMYQFERSLYQ
jgi:hypothetical protein